MRLLGMLKIMENPFKNQPIATREFSNDIISRYLKIVQFPAGIVIKKKHIVTILPYNKEKRSSRAFSPTLVGPRIQLAVAWLDGIHTVIPEEHIPLVEKHTPVKVRCIQNCFIDGGTKIFLLEKQIGLFQEIDKIMAHIEKPNNEDLDVYVYSNDKTGPGKNKYLVLFYNTQHPLSSEFKQKRKDILLQDPMKESLSNWGETCLFPLEEIYQSPNGIEFHNFIFYSRFKTYLKKRGKSNV